MSSLYSPPTETGVERVGVTPGSLLLRSRVTRGYSLGLLTETFSSVKINYLSFVSMICLIFEVMETRLWNQGYGIQGYRIKGYGIKGYEVIL